MNRNVKLAAILMSFFAVFLVVEAVGVAAVESRFDPQHFAVHILGAVVWSLVVWALLRGRRWAWLTVVTYGSLMGALVVAGLLTAWSAGIPLQTLAREVGVGLRLGTIGLPLGVFSVAALVASVGLLLKKDAREVFLHRKAAGRP